jgi:hypothetical protein
MEGRTRAIKISTFRELTKSGLDNMCPEARVRAYIYITTLIIYLNDYIWLGEVIDDPVGVFLPVPGLWVCEDIDSGLDARAGWGWREEG